MACVRILRPEQRPEAMHVAGFDIQALISGDQAQAFEVFFTTGKDGSGAAPHAHPWDDTFFVLRGPVLCGMGEEEQWVDAGTLAPVPGGERHWYRFGDQASQFLSLTSGKAAAAMYRDLADWPDEAPRSDYRAAALRHGQQARPT